MQATGERYAREPCSEDRSTHKRLRNLFGSGAVALALAAGAALPPASAGQASPARVAKVSERPNILFVQVDDMGFGDLSIMGNRKVQTPNIDRLAR